MALTPQFHEAVRILDAFSDKDRLLLEGLCMKIRASEAALTDAAAPLLKRCIFSCQGLCCRNVTPESLIHMMDFVFILALDRSLEKTVSSCLKNENALYTSDCIFLKDGTGPCIFPDDLRPQVCITAFCGKDHSVGKEIARVKKAFVRMEWFIRIRKLKTLGKWIQHSLSDRSFRV